MSTYRIQSAAGEWEVMIGLEVHAQIIGEAKPFSGASTEFGGELAEQRGEFSAGPEQWQWTEKCGEPRGR